MQLTMKTHMRLNAAEAGSANLMRNIKLVVIMPALNEEKSISGVIRGIPRIVAGVDELELIVIDDGSSDATAKLARKAGCTVISHDHSRGVGAAFQTGIREALRRGADIIVNIDSDGQMNPGEIPLLIAPIQKSEAHFVTGSRFTDKKYAPTMPKIKIWGNRWMTHIINMITRKKFTDVSCGFRAYSREAALRLTLFGNFTYTQETFIDLAFKNISMTEVPVNVRGEREYGESRMAHNLWRYGIKSATIIFRAARDFRPHYFFGIPGLIIFGVGVASGIFLLVHYVSTGQTYPYRSLVTVSGVFIMVGFMLLFLSMLADMLHRNRIIAEEAVYHARKATYTKINGS